MGVAPDAFLLFHTEDDVRNWRPQPSPSWQSVPFIVFQKGAFKANTPEYLVALARQSPGTVVLWDAYDGDGLVPELLPLLGGRIVYLKANISDRTRSLTTQSIHPIPQWPVPKTQKVARAIKFKPFEDREFDMVFVGNKNWGEPKRRYRHKRIAALEKACDKLKLKVFFRNRPMAPAKYARLMANSKLAYSPPGSGYRCRRDWEIPLSGAALLLDYILQQEHVAIPDFNPVQHFLFLEEDVDTCLHRLINDYKMCEHMAKRGYDLARECYVEHPVRLCDRYVRAYLLNPECGSITSHCKLVAAEEELDVD